MRFFYELVIIMILFFASFLRSEVDKVYHPYVELDTYEFEARLIGLLDRETASEVSIYRFGFGKDITERLFLEFYIIGAQESSQRFEVEAYEIEALYQLTEQGEYWADFGLLFEIEREKNTKEWEGNIALLIEKEFGIWSAALNFQNKFLYQDDMAHEWKSNQAFQLRYRSSPSFEPGLEIYSDKDSNYIGAVALGQIRLDHSKLNWEFGFLRGFNHLRDGNVVRALIEYEF